MAKNAHMPSALRTNQPHDRRIILLRVMSLPIETYQRFREQMKSFDLEICGMMNVLFPHDAKQEPSRRDEFYKLWNELGDVHFHLITAIEFNRQILEKRKS